MIEGGYILQPRKIDDSESSIKHAPPLVRELWAYLLRKVNHRGNGKFKRGQGFFRFEDIQNDLSWHVGYRVMRYSKPQLTKSLRRLREGNAIATSKATRGLFITILKYNYYQDPGNYESNTEETAKVQRKKREGLTKNKNVKEVKNELIKHTPDKPDDIQIIFTYWQKIHNHKRAKLDVTRKKKITARIKDGYSIDEIKMAIDGCKLSPHHMGKNDTGTIYDDIELICRDSKHIDGFIKQKESLQANEWGMK